jgi:hypothetical protein
MSTPLLKSFKEIIACDDRERLEGMLVVAALTAPHLMPAIERQLHRLQAEHRPPPRLLDPLRLEYEVTPCE